MDPIRAYFKDVRHIPLLTAEEEIDLSRKLLSGDKQAREQMIKSNLRLVISIAKRYMNLGIPLSDLIEEGNIGLMRAVEKFDPEKGFRFSTYAAWWIKQSVSRSIVDQGKMIRIPVYMNEELAKYKKAVEKLTHKLKRKPRVAEIAKTMQLGVDRVREIRQCVTKMSSLDAPIGEEGEGQFKDVVEDTTLEAPHEELEGFLNKERTLDLLSMMDDREREVLDLRFGITDGEKRTLAEIAKRLGVSRERIRQLEVGAIKKLREIFHKQEKGFQEESE
ncbi:MAG: sigma-70 family RNA polymerase sigma factor [Candidatus Omnitrophica bacterium]|nr:sigma-70 family RNA polymerase sigma factor [Candidatus Omnitrophota bacterium]